MQIRFSTAAIARMIVFVAVVCLSSVTTAAQDTSRFEVGPLLTQMYVPSRTVGSVTYQPAFGGIFSIAITRYVEFDSSISFTPKAPNESTAFAGGRMTQGFLGVRAGFRRGRVGLYAKARPGFASFGSIILKITPPPAFSFQLGRLTPPSLDVGGLVIITISRRLAVRYDLGDTLIFYGGKVLSPGSTPIPSRTTNNLQFAAGFLFRF